MSIDPAERDSLAAMLGAREKRLGANAHAVKIFVVGTVLDTFG